MNTRKVPHEVGRYYRKLYSSRQSSDYGDLVQFQAAEVRAWFEQATDLVELLARQVEYNVRASVPGA